MNRVSHQSRSPDYAYIGLLAMLVVFGLVMLVSASSDLGKTEFGDPYYYLKHQMLNGLSVGVVGFFVGAFVYYRRWEKFALPALLFSIITLALIFASPGASKTGADRWLDIGTFTFQPSELLKLTFLMYLAAWISKKQTLRSKSFIGGLVPFTVLLCSVAALLLAQPATTTTILIIVAALVMYFTAGARIRLIATLILLLVLGLTVFVTAGGTYRFDRIQTFLNPEADVLGSGYHINQAQSAIGSGGLTGVGFGQSKTKLYSLPEPIGDSIFAVIGEELGFIGSMTLLLVFFAFILRGFRIAKRAPEEFGKLLATGFTAVIGVQTIVNIGAISGLLPLTGVPLPFISYGGTSLAVFLTMSGIVVNISKYS